ncbi:MAG TPA: hypothetical protein DDW82_02730 [Acholeplasmataceae bacterium]|nr:hypothetical protein [Acholeplasmataceae bacterium]HCB67202.1 hypothetical protein [Acholeplasmataceae bacterium]
MKKLSLKAIGYINVFMPGPLLFFTIVLSWGIVFDIFNDMLGINIVYEGFTFLMLSPLLIPPVFGIYGMVISIKRRQEKDASLCFILSLLGIILMATTISVIYYLGSTY